MKTTSQQTVPLEVQDDQNLSIEQAADRLVNEESILAAGFPDFTEDAVYNSYPEPVVLSPTDFYGLRLKQILRHLQGYERFEVYP